MESSTHKLHTLKISTDLDKNGVTDGENTERHKKDTTHTWVFKAITTNMEDEIKEGEKEAHGLPSLNN